MKPCGSRRDVLAAVLAALAIHMSAATATSAALRSRSEASQAAAVTARSPAQHRRKGLGVPAQLAPLKLVQLQGSTEYGDSAGKPEWLSFSYGYWWVYATFVPLLLVTLALAWFTRPRTTEPLTDDFCKYRWKYLSVWSLAVAADWFQGPYVYALYESYGWNSGEIAELFVTGFGASMIFGTFVGSLADRYGRKRCAVLYCILYAISCLTKHVNVFSVLMLGRITGGISTSLLFSSFECWMVSEHLERHGFSQALLRYMFGCMFFIMYGVAIICGLVAQVAADAKPLTVVATTSFGQIYTGGNTVPFDLSFLVLVCLIPVICLLWEENYGDATNARSSQLLGSVVDSCRLIVSEPRVALVGIVVTAFEGVMYAFVFNWTPALTLTEAAEPHGTIFSLMMMACMCGASVFGLSNPNIRPTIVLMPNLLIAVVALFVTGICLQLGSTTSRLLTAAIFFMFLIFEFNVGVYFPAIGTCKSDVVPEANRAAVYNLFRVPLNFLVCVVLLVHMPLSTSFYIQSGVMMVGFAGLIALLWCSGPSAKTKSSADDKEAPAECTVEPKLPAAEKLQESAKTLRERLQVNKEDD
jgi:MFS family permease